MTKNEKSRLRATTQKTFIWVAMLTIGVVQFFPLLWVVNFSLCKDSDVFASGILKIPNPPVFENYRQAFINGKILHYSLNSIMMTVITIVITGFFSLTLGYAFARMKWKLNKPVLSLILIGMIIPIHTTLIPNFIIFSRLGILDTPPALIIPYAAFSLPLGVFIMTGFISSVPRALEEAAVIDGCGIYTVIFQVVFPLTKTALVTIAVMTFLNCWNEFIMAATFLNSTTYKTLPFAVYEFSGQYVSRYAIQFAVMVLAIIPALIVYGFLNEQIAKGVTLGALKG